MLTSIAPSARNSLERYEGHLNLPGIGLDGQKKLKNTAVLCIGIGSLGCPVSAYLAAAGVGQIGLVDSDLVEESNFQRQLLYGQQSLGKRKSSSAKSILESINSEITLEEFPVRLSKRWVERLFPQYDIVVDTTDNFSTRLLINSGCVKYKKPLISASVYRFEGQLGLFNHQNGPCYECLFPITEKDTHEEEDCSKIGIFSTLTGIMGTLQANEVLKLALGLGESLSGKLLVFDSLSLNSQILTYSKNPDCFCNNRTFVDNEQAEENPSQSSYFQARGMSPETLKNLIESGTNILILDTRPNDERTSFHIPGSQKLLLGDILEKPEQLKDIKAKHLVLYCNSEFRAKKGVERLLEAGVSSSYLIGGFREWRRQGLPVERCE